MDQSKPWRKDESRRSCVHRGYIHTCSLRRRGFATTYTHPAVITHSLSGAVSAVTTSPKPFSKAASQGFELVMFHTFNLDAQPPRVQPVVPAFSGSDTPRKRQKVSKACDRCRTFRVKCGEKPCEQCLLNKAKCITSSEAFTDQTFRPDFTTV